MLRAMPDRHSTGGRILYGCRTAVVGVAFWAAVLFPALHVFLALQGGYAESQALLSLVGVHALALLVGHRHSPVEQVEHAEAGESVGV